MFSSSLFFLTHPFLGLWFSSSSFSLLKPCRLRSDCSVLASPEKLTEQNRVGGSELLGLWCEPAHLEVPRTESVCFVLLRCGSFLVNAGHLNHGWCVQREKHSPAGTPVQPPGLSRAQPCCPVLGQSALRGQHCAGTTGHTHAVPKLVLEPVCKVAVLSSSLLGSFP